MCIRLFETVTIFSILSAVAVLFLTVKLESTLMHFSIIIIMLLPETAS